MCTDKPRALPVGRRRKDEEQNPSWGTWRSIILTFKFWIFLSFYFLHSVYLELTFCLVSLIAYYLILHLGYWFSFCFSLVSSPVPYVWSAGVGSLSHVRLSATPWTVAHQASLSFTISQSLLKLMSIELVMASDLLILCSPLLLFPLIFLSITVLSSELALHIRWPKDWSFSFRISPSNEYSGFISFRVDWFDLLAVQGTLKSLPQKHNLKTILRHLAFFMVQLSHDY